jgi:hypothetical protein
MEIGKGYPEVVALRVQYDDSHKQPTFAYNTKIGT